MGGWIGKERHSRHFDARFSPRRSVALTVKHPFQENVALIKE